MKKTVLMLAFFMGLGTSVGMAGEKLQEKVEITVSDEGFTQIDMDQIPEAVLVALEKNFDGQSVKTVAVKMNEDDTCIYKVILIDNDNKETEALFSDEGEALAR